MYSQNKDEHEFSRRKPQLARALAHCDGDLILLQEVDHYEDFYGPCLKNLGYTCQYYSRPGRQDGLLIGYREGTVALKKYEEVSFDDLAIVYDDPIFRKQNIAQLAMFTTKTKDTAEETETETEGTDFCITNCHLFWNPQKAEIKRAQTRYMIEKLEIFATQDTQDSHTGSDLDSDPSGIQGIQKGIQTRTQTTRETRATRVPVVMGGDFNSLPDSELVGRLTSGNWRAESTHFVVDGLSYSNRGPKTAFLADITLKKLASWMRILGIDCALETEEMHDARTKKVKKGEKGEIRRLDYSLLFNAAREQQRVIITSSRQLRERVSCPPSCFVKTNNFEQSLATIVQKYGLHVGEDTFLTRCGKCGGEIKGVDVEEKRKELGKDDYLPTDGRPVFSCVECKQPYWWNDRADSSPARAM